MTRSLRPLCGELLRDRIAICCGLAAFLGVALCSTTRVRAQAPTDDSSVKASPSAYDDAVAPILARSCTSCHNDEDRDGGLSLETYEDLRRGGESGPSIIPGRGESSLLYRVVARLEKPYMPPGRRRPLSAEQVALLRRWIDDGAPGPRAPGRRSPLDVPHIPVVGEPRRPIHSVAYSPDGVTIALGRYGFVELYSAERREVVARLDGPPGAVMDVEFSANGATLAAGGGEPGRRGIARLFDVRSGALLHEFRGDARFAGHGDAITAVALGGRGVLATASYDGSIRIWDTTSGVGMRSPRGHEGPVFDLAFRLGGDILASASGDRTVKLWRPESGDRIETLSESTKDLYAVAFSPDGSRLIAGGVDRRIRVWELGPDAREGTNRLLHSRFAHEGAILDLRYSPDGRSIVSAADDRSVKVWSAGTVAPRLVLEPQPDWPVAVAVSPDSMRAVVARIDGTVAVYSLPLGTAVRVARGASPSTATFLARTVFLALALLEDGADEAPGKKKGDGKPAKPELVRVSPQGVERGRETSIRLVGKNLAGAREVRIHGTGKIEASITEGEREQITLRPSADLAPGRYELSLVGPGGDSEKVAFFVGDLPHVYEDQLADAGDVLAIDDGRSVWGSLSEAGDVDTYAFRGRAGEMVVFDVASEGIGAKADLVLDLLDADGRILARVNDVPGRGRDPIAAYELPADGVYRARLYDLQLRGTPEFEYRVDVGTFAYVTGTFPLSVSAGRKSTVELVGFNIGDAEPIEVERAQAGEIDVSLPPGFRSRGAIRVEATSELEIVETEPNDEASKAGAVSVPVVVSGRIAASGTGIDVDLHRFTAEAGTVYLVETDAARRRSPLDTKIEILDAAGVPVPRVLLRAVRDTSINFRPINSDQSGARLDNWEEMTLDQYLYLQGDVCRLFRMPQGPDSDMIFYTSAGKRRAYFGTTATAHPLQENGYIVDPHPPGARLSPNGLPTFLIHYENDDAGRRTIGSDSRLYFTAPATGEYCVRVTSVTGEQSPRHTYRLVVRPARPDFAVRIGGRDASVPRGSGRGFTVSVDRKDGYEGPIRIEIDGVPPGMVVSTPIEIQADQMSAQGTIFATPDATAVDARDDVLRLTATARIGGEEVSRVVGTLGSVKIADPPALLVDLQDVDSVEADPAPTWIALRPRQFIADSGTVLTPRADGALLASGSNPLTETYTITYDADLEEIDALRLEVLSDPSLPANGPGRADNGNLVITRIGASAAPRSNPASIKRLVFKAASADFTQSGFSPAALIDDDAKTGWAIARRTDKGYIVPKNSDGDPSHAATLELAKPLELAADGALKLTLEQHSGATSHNVGCFRVSARGRPRKTFDPRPVELTIAPGETIRALLRVERRSHKNRITFRVDNLPHGVIVDNIGLNGVLMPPNVNEREIFLTAYDWVPETSRLCHAVTNEAGAQTSRPVLLHVKRRAEVAGARTAR